MKKILVILLVSIFLLVTVAAYAAPPRHRPYVPPPPRHHHPRGPDIIIVPPPIVIEPDYSGGDPQCFISTSVYGGKHPVTEILRSFRDKCLLTSNLGTKLVAYYYKVGPRIAKYLDKNAFLKPAIGLALIPVIEFCYLVI